MTKILITAAKSLVGNSLINKMKGDFKFYCIDNENNEYIKNSITYINWTKIFDNKFDYIFSLDSPNQNQLLAFPRSNLERIFVQGKLINNYLNLNPQCKLIVFSSVSVLGKAPIVASINQQINSPQIYGVVKHFQEIILTTNLSKNRFKIIRLPAVLTEKSIIHLPSRYLNNLTKNEDLVIMNPNLFWNACLSIFDLILILKSIIYQFEQIESIHYPHAGGEETFYNIASFMKEFLGSKSKLIKVEKMLDHGTRLIKTKNIVNTASVYDSLRSYMKLNQDLNSYT